VDLEIPKLRTLTFETAIIQRYQRWETSVEEALVEMYLAGVSIRRIEDITELLWDAKLSAGTVSRLNVKVYEQIEAWRQRSLEGQYPYVYLYGVYLCQDNDHLQVVKGDRLQFTLGSFWDPLQLDKQLLR